MHIKVKTKKRFRFGEKECDSLGNRKNVNWKIVVISGKTGSEEFDFDKKALIVGRHSSCDIVIREKGVSKAHCCLTDAGGTVVVKDMGSTNGTLLRGLEIKGPIALSSGQSVQIGDVFLRVVRVENKANAAAVKKLFTARYAMWCLLAPVLSCLAGMLFVELTTEKRKYYDFPAEEPREAAEPVQPEPAIVPEAPEAPVVVSEPVVPPPVVAVRKDPRAPLPAPAPSPLQPAFVVKPSEPVAPDAIRVVVETVPECSVFSDEKQEEPVLSIDEMIDAVHEADKLVFQHQTPMFYGNEITGQVILFILDTSGSMSGERIQTLKSELATMLKNLEGVMVATKNPPKQSASPQKKMTVYERQKHLMKTDQATHHPSEGPPKVGLIFYDSKIDDSWATPLLVTEKVPERTTKIERICASGGTNMEDAWKTAFAVIEKENVDTVYFLTDGEGSPKTLELIKHNWANDSAYVPCVINCVGIYADPGRFAGGAVQGNDKKKRFDLLQEIAAFGGGVYTQK